MIVKAKYRILLSVYSTPLLEPLSVLLVPSYISNELDAFEWLILL